MSASVHSPDVDASERRQLTVLFCDLVNSVGLAERCDPEDLQAILRFYHQACGDRIAACGGQIVQYLGDGIVAQFGYPLVTENSAKAATRAAVQIRDGLKTLNERLRTEHSETIQIRMGVHTGIVVVSTRPESRAGESMQIVGGTPNIAARLQGLAEPDGIVISDATHRLLEETFAVKALGPQSLKGISEPVKVFQILHESAQDERARFSRGGLRAAFTGREAEIARLMDLWRLVVGGRGQIALITGEAGIGKSRLCAEFCTRASISSDAVFLLQCSADHQNVPYVPIVSYLTRRIGVEPADADDLNITRAHDYLASLGLDAPDNQALLAHVLGLRPMTEGDSEEIRRRTRDFAVALLLARARNHACVCVIEDIHWADPSSLAVLQHLVAILGEHPILVLLTGRSAERLGANLAPDLVPLRLGRLDSADVRDIATGLIGASPLPSETLSEIVRRADGVPLFVEELLAAMLQTGAVATERSSTASPAAVPAAIYDSLMVRLDRLGPARRLAQIAAVIGREFSAQLLSTVCASDDEIADDRMAHFADHLAALTDADIIQPQRRGSTARYTFRHALLRDIAYESLVRSQRRALHGRVAAALKERFPEVADAEPDYLARHLTQAGDTQEAAREWMRAARLSANQSANLESLAQVDAALDLIPNLPAGPMRDGMELEAHLLLIGPTIATEGYAARRISEATDRALFLARQLQDTRRIFPALYSQWSYKQFTGNIHGAHRVAEEFLTLATRAGSRPALMLGHRLLGSTLLLTARFHEARRELRAAAELYAPQEDRALGLAYGADPYVMSLSHLSIVSWMIGSLQESVTQAESALAHAMGLAHANSIGYATSHICTLHLLRRDVAAVEAVARRFLAATAERNLPFWKGVGQGFLGWCLIEAGRPEEGAAILRRQLAVFERLDLKYSVPIYLCWLADALNRAGHRAEALERLASARALMEQGGEIWYEPEVLRIEGIVTMTEPRERESGRGYLERAMKLAQARGQVVFHLRSALALARTFRDDGDIATARALVEESALPLTSEDTVDVREAKAFLRELGH